MGSSSVAALQVLALLGHLHVRLAEALIPPIRETDDGTRVIRRQEDDDVALFHRSSHNHMLQGMIRAMRVNADGSITGEEISDDARNMNLIDPDPEEANWVSCGGHRAPSCSVCAMTDSRGNQVFNHGYHWCHGDCVYDNATGSCRSKASIQPAPVVDDSASTDDDVADDATAQRSPLANPAAPTPLADNEPDILGNEPDILNPNITDYDEKVIEDAAEGAIREENAAAAEHQRKEEQAEKDKQWSWAKIFTYGGIASGCCAICSCIGLVAFICMGSAGNSKDADGKEGDPDTNGDGEDAGEIEGGADAEGEDVDEIKGENAGEQDGHANAEAEDGGGWFGSWGATDGHAVAAEAEDGGENEGHGWFGSWGATDSPAVAEGEDAGTWGENDGHEDADGEDEHAVAEAEVDVGDSWEDAGESWADAGQDAQPHDEEASL